MKTRYVTLLSLLAGAAIGALSVGGLYRTEQVAWRLRDRRYQPNN